MRTLGCFLGLFLVGFGCIAAFTYPAWLLLHPHFSFPFHRIGERIGMLALLVGLSVVARPLGLIDRASFGFGVARRPFTQEALLGLALGIATMAALVCVMSAVGLLNFSRAAHVTFGGCIKLLFAGALSAVAVAFIEETFLRGALFTGIERESGGTAAVIGTSLIYSATHFFASYKIAPDQVTAGSGVTLVLGTLHLFADPSSIADAFLCLFAVGMVLGTIRRTTGNIAACIGLHAGWVWVMLVVHELSAPQRGAAGGFLLSRFDGFVGWLVLAWTIPMGIGLRRLYINRSGINHRG